jgi:hypothetical protein
MILRTIRFGAFRHFIDQRLDLDSEVTVLVGRNDTGKTSVLNDFMRNFYGQWMFGTDGPKLPGGATMAPRQKYSLEWEIRDEDRDKMSAAFGPAGAGRRLLASFDEEPTNKWAYEIDGTALPDSMLSHRNLFPVPSYVHVAGPDGPRDRLLPHRFAAQFAKLEGGNLEAPTYPDPVIPIEGVLARLGGFGSHTRRLPGPGVDEPWEPSLAVPGPSVAELNEAFRQVGVAVSEQLSQWWGEPSGVDFRVSVLGSQARNSYWVTCEIKTKNGLMMNGAGIRWFVALVLELLFLKATGQRRLLLFDEPGAPLHPTAQRSVMRLLAAFAADAGSQLIYSTHSPFMLDWSFPQRIRLFERDYETGKGAIVNNPYHPGNRFTTVWDPLWSTIGVTLGDLSQLGETNVFVEGVTDQIILANASADARSRGLAHFDLPRTAIVPYSDHQALQHLLNAAGNRAARCVAIIDTDRRSAESNIQQFQRAGVQCLRLDEFSDTPGAKAAIEDVVGVDDYVLSLNASYGTFGWFAPLDVAEVRTKRGVKTLGRYLSDVFDGLGQTLNKVRVATEIAARFQSLNPTTKARLDRLVAKASGVLDAGAKAP